MQDIAYFTSSIIETLHRKPSEKEISAYLPVWEDYLNKKCNHCLLIIEKSTSPGDYTITILEQHIEQHKQKVLIKIKTC